MATSISVPYKMLHEGGISESVNDGTGPTATVKFVLENADDRYQFCRDIIGVSTRNGSLIVREPPFRYPAAPYLAATSIPSIEPLGGGFRSRFFPFDGRWLYREKCAITVVFGVYPYSFDGPGNLGQPWVTANFDMSSEFITVPGAVYRYADGTPTDEKVGRMIPETDISMTVHRLPYAPLDEVANVQGKLNNAPFRILNRAFDVGTLLFRGGQSTIDVDSIGSINCTANYRFLFRPIPHNFFLKPTRTGGFQVITDGNGDTVYQLGDFTQLPT